MSNHFGGKSFHFGGKFFVCPVASLFRVSKLSKVQNIAKHLLMGCHKHHRNPIQSNPVFKYFSGCQYDICFKILLFPCKAHNNLATS